ncbi:9572_t:CDS:1, partial [Entrophospora sp. SA101]
QSTMLIQQLEGFWYKKFGVTSCIEFLTPEQFIYLWHYDIGARQKS